MYTDSACVGVVLTKHNIYDKTMSIDDYFYGKYKNLGRNIQKYRLEKGLSQEKLSELIDANLKFIGHIERLERKPSFDKFLLIAYVLGVEPGDLLKNPDD